MKRCGKQIPMKFTGRSGLSKRRTFCCPDRHGFMIKHWKCKGLGSPDCPKSKLTKDIKEPQ